MLVSDLAKDSQYEIWLKIVPVNEGRAGWMIQGFLNCNLSGTDSPRLEASRTECTPKNLTARVLQSPNPNDIDPAWRGHSRIGSSSGFIQEASVKTETGLYLVGGLVSPRGAVQRPVFVLPDEWNCATGVQSN